MYYLSIRTSSNFEAARRKNRLSGFKMRRMQDPVTLPEHRRPSLSAGVAEPVGMRDAVITFFRREVVLIR
jgi:hypothetical protein